MVSCVWTGYTRTLTLQQPTLSDHCRKDEWEKESVNSAVPTGTVVVSCTAPVHFCTNLVTSHVFNFV